MHGTITDLQAKPRDPKRMVLFLDGRYAFTLHRELAGLLRVGEQLEEASCEALVAEDEGRRALDRALRYLGQRPRSEREMRDYLLRRCSPELTATTLERLARDGYVDDQTFASYWVEQRRTHRPRGERLLRAELRQKGISDQLAREAIEAGDDPADQAYRAGQKAAARWAKLPYQDFRRKLGAHLARRGFDWEIIRSCVARLWRETAGQASQG